MPERSQLTLGSQTPQEPGQKSANNSISKRIVIDSSATPEDDVLDHLSTHSTTHTHVHSAHVHTAHVHSEESLRKIINRLSRLEGHIRGVKTLVQENRACPDVLIQIAAVRGGLDRLARIILDEHLSECVTRAVDDGNIETEVEALKSALDRFIR